MYEPQKSMLTSPSHFSGFRLLVLFAGLLWTVGQIFPIFGGSHGLNISAYGDHSALLLPDSYKLELTDVKGARIEMKSLWKFNVKNEGNQDATDLTFQLPFDGFYKVLRPGETANANGVAGFEKTIKIESIAPSDQVSVLVWTNSDVEPNQERETKISSPNGSVSISYPVKVTGFLAWVERSKLLIAVMASIAFLLLFL